MSRRQTPAPGASASLSGAGLVAAGTALSYAIGWALGVRLLLPILNTLPALPFLYASLRRGRVKEAIARMLAWAAALAVCATVLSYWRPADTERLFINGAAYREEMFAWVRIGEGREGDPARFVPQHAAHAAGFCVLSLASGSLLSMPMGAVLRALPRSPRRRAPAARARNGRPYHGYRAEVGTGARLAGLGQGGGGMVARLRDRRAAAVAVFAAALLWLTGLVVAPWLAAHGSRPATMAASVTYVLGRAVCHQRPDRSFHLHGAQLPVCVRCFGLYAAAPIGAALALRRRRAQARRDEETSATRRIRLLLALAALPTAITVVAEGSGLLPAPGWLRAVSAAPLGAAVAWALGAAARGDLR